LNHFPLDAFTQKFALETCKAGAYYADCAQKVVEQRESFIAFLRERRWNVLQSQTNFVFCQKNGVDGKGVYETLKKKRASLCAALTQRESSNGLE